MANDTNRLAGTAYLSVDGTTYMVAGAFEYSPAKVTRETLTGMDGVHGYSEKPKAGHISATLRDSGGLSVASINAMTNVTVVAELANGKTIVGRNMWTVEDQTAKAEDATIEVKWEGLSVTEQ
ncbi:phage tail tube protein [Variovorax sp. PAMC26660]|uniref:phage tail tube protein n=1 Tax=Variovorax sp. PAMC26660 TaxID=2762322 RepID=UPI00164DC1B5|nr:phage tail tube protein [Variovorax sp. PAMC26660]QNK65761.1 phage tail tube protein [Variovorax sp. PAMC26660]